MANNEDVNQANQGAPAADIPDLKQKEKERKKAGVAWSGANPSGSFAGARAAASAGAAAAGGTATIFGRGILTALLAAFLAAAGLFGYAMLKGGEDVAGGGGGDLGAIASSIKIRADGGDRTGYIASKGEIKFDPINAAPAKKAETAPGEKAAGEAPPAEKAADADAAGQERSGLQHNMSGSKLSSSLGGGFGGKNIFSGNTGPKFNSSLGKINIPGAQKGRLTASRNARTGRSAGQGRRRGIGVQGALNQLVRAQGLSTTAATATTAEDVGSTASDAFEGGPQVATLATEGPVLPTPNPTPGPSPTAPIVPKLDDGTKAALAAIERLIREARDNWDKANSDMKRARWWAAAAALTCNGGAAAVSYYYYDKHNKENDKADELIAQAWSMNGSLASHTHDTNQEKIDKYCINKMIATGIGFANCNPPVDDKGKFIE